MNDYIAYGIAAAIVVMTIVNLILLINTRKKHKKEIEDREPVPDTLPPLSNPPSVPLPPPLPAYTNTGDISTEGFLAALSAGLKDKQTRMAEIEKQVGDLKAEYDKLKKDITQIELVKVRLE